MFIIINNNVLSTLRVEPHSMEATQFFPICGLFVPQEIALYVIQPSYSGTTTSLAYCPLGVHIKLFPWHSVMRYPCNQAEPYSQYSFLEAGNIIGFFVFFFRILHSPLICTGNHKSSTSLFLSHILNRYSFFFFCDIAQVLQFYVTTGLYYSFVNNNFSPGEANSSKPQNIQ